MSKLEAKLEKKDIVLLLIVIILIIINLTIYLKNILLPQKQENQTYKITSTIKEETQTITVPKTQEELIKKLSKLDERSRIEYYCGEYFKHIEKKEYTQAYELLYPEFKEKYFPTIESYEEYIKKTYPKNWALEYNDITRQGSIYVLQLYILDINGSKDNKKSQRIVIKENNYIDFVISFQVI